MNANKMKLTVKKINGIIIEVTLVKEELIIDQNVINSFILDGKSKIGYTA